MSRKRKRSGRFGMLPLSVFTHDAVKTLSHGEHRVLVAYACQFNGGNNGSLALTRSQAADLGIGHTILQRAQRTLQDRGLIRLTRQGTRTPPAPNLYALTWLGIDAGKHDARPNPRPSMDFLRWSPRDCSEVTGSTDSDDRSEVMARDPPEVTGSGKAHPTVTAQKSRSGVFHDRSEVTFKI